MKKKVLVWDCTLASGQSHQDLNYIYHTVTCTLANSNKAHVNRLYGEQQKFILIRIIIIIIILLLLLLHTFIMRYCHPSCLATVEWIWSVRQCTISNLPTVIVCLLGSSTNPTKGYFKPYQSIERLIIKNNTNKDDRKNKPDVVLGGSTWNSTVDFPKAFHIRHV